MGSIFEVEDDVVEKMKQERFLNKSECKFKEPQG
jgi:hypothetical protein